MTSMAAALALGAELALSSPTRHRRSIGGVDGDDNDDDGGGGGDVSSFYSSNDAAAASSSRLLRLSQTPTMTAPAAPEEAAEAAVMVPAAHSTRAVAAVSKRQQQQHQQQRQEDEPVSQPFARRRGNDDNDSNNNNNNNSDSSDDDMLPAGPLLDAAWLRSQIGIDDAELHEIKVHKSLMDRLCKSSKSVEQRLQRARAQLRTLMRFKRELTGERSYSKSSSSPQRHNVSYKRLLKNSTIQAWCKACLLRRELSSIHESFRNIVSLATDDPTANRKDRYALQAMIGRWTHEHAQLFAEHNLNGSGEKKKKKQQRRSADANLASTTTAEVKARVASAAQAFKASTLSTQEQRVASINQVLKSRLPSPHAAIAAYLKSIQNVTQIVYTAYKLGLGTRSRLRTAANAYFIRNNQLIQDIQQEQELRAHAKKALAHAQTKCDGILDQHDQVVADLQASQRRLRDTMAQARKLRAAARLRASEQELTGGGGGGGGSSGAATSPLSPASSALLATPLSASTTRNASPSPPPAAAATATAKKSKQQQQHKLNHRGLTAARAKRAGAVLVLKPSLIETHGPMDPLLQAADSKQWEAPLPQQQSFAARLHTLAEDQYRGAPEYPMPPKRPATAGAAAKLRRLRLAAAASNHNNNSTQSPPGFGFGTGRGRGRGKLAMMTPHSFAHHTNGAQRDKFSRRRNILATPQHATSAVNWRKFYESTNITRARVAAFAEIHESKRAAAAAAAAAATIASPHAAAAAGARAGLAAAAASSSTSTAAAAKRFTFDNESPPKSIRRQSEEEEQQQQKKESAAAAVGGGGGGGGLHVDAYVEAGIERRGARWANSATRLVQQASRKRATRRFGGMTASNRHRAMQRLRNSPYLQSAHLDTASQAAASTSDGGQTYADMLKRKRRDVAANVYVW
jgi:hypothetical protein